MPSTTARSGNAGDSAPRPRNRKRHRPREILLGMVFCIPALAGLGTFVFFPLVQALFLSTRGTDINGNPSRSVGGQNFAQLFTPEFGTVLLHTLFFTLFVVAAGVVLPMALAVPLAQRLPGMRVFRTLFTLPFAYSASAASVVWLLMLDPSMSPVNWLLELLGMDAPGWTTESPWALLTVAWATVWVASGFNLLVLGAGLAGVDEDVLEAARLDGATGLRSFFSVVLPMISPSVFFVVVTTTLTSLQALGQVQVMTDGGPNGSTSTLVFSIYHNAFENGNNNYGLASAQGLVLLVVGIVLAAIQFGVVERRVHYR
ncbi:carbohydrate ABC transporter membrane protein 1 (CUT1 family) [Amycolatopsis echigonensis]|uniref:Carbohydrate ABC transporter membrane protein 1 (CUT1 family) n=1 Tax=Amycolatopsis echigonensis TaxID=2576905 RepID=A0A2N3WL52_9PSEU|nr:carbohydrate ABC transporter membrane protein 1 (CUT1 family) [Amycolatopsis niigatensis]